jgi:hypothetical protein
LTLTGGGILEVSGDTNANDGTLVIENGIVGGNGVIGGDVSTVGGIIRPRVGNEFSNLTINGDFSGNVVLSGDNATAHDSLTGQGGVANIDVLTLELPRGQFRGGEVYELLPGWSEITVAELRLPVVSSSGWDTSRLSEGIVSILPGDPLRCDLDQSGSCDVLDLDFLGNRINGTYEQSADLNRDGTIDLLDRDELLLELGGIFLGDADLDGDVDVSDLNPVGFHWQQCDSRSWSGADFNFDGCVDSRDLNEVGKNWQRGVARFASTGIESVPEPTGHLLWLFGLLLLLGRVHISRLAISQLSFCRGRCP